MAILNVMGRGHTYFPDELRDKGYKGKLEAIPDACCLVVPLPGAKERDVAKSLRILAEDFDHKADIRGEEKQEPALEVSAKYPFEIDGKEYRLILNWDTKRFRLEPIKK